MESIKACAPSNSALQADPANADQLKALNAWAYRTQTGVTGTKQLGKKEAAWQARSSSAGRSNSANKKWHEGTRGCLASNKPVLVGAPGVPLQAQDQPAT